MQVEFSPIAQLTNLFVFPKMIELILMLPLKDQAIKSALNNNWTEAIQINLAILQENPKDLDSLNRLGFSYLKCQQYKKAKEAFENVISFDKTNPIAVKNLKKIQALSANKTKENSNINSIDGLFIQETGKTKAIELRNLADKKILLLLETADAVNLVIKRSKVFVQKEDKTYIGMLPDDIGMRLISLINGGNEYQACIMNADDRKVTIFVKEVKKSKKFANQPSFTLA